MSHPEERREFQRLHLDWPIPATFAGAQVLITEIGVLGLRVQHKFPLLEKTGEVEFVYRGESLALRCEIVRQISDPSTNPKKEYESGVRIIAAKREAGNSLRTMLADLVTKELKLRRDTPFAMDSMVDGDRTVRGADAGFVTYRFEKGIWLRRHVFLPEQPSVGFTIAHSEDSEEIQRLCRVYAASDEEGRRLIRLFAELSVSEALQIPPKGE